MMSRNDAKIVLPVVFGGLLVFFATVVGGLTVA
jgi:hypothetical protein